MNILCKFFAIGLIVLSCNSKLFAPIEDDAVFNRSVDRVPGVKALPGTPEGGFRAELYRTPTQKKLALQQQTGQQKTMAAAPRKKQQIIKAQNFDAQQQKPPVAIPRVQKRFVEAQKFENQRQPNPEIDINHLLKQVEMDGKRRKEEGDADEIKKIENIKTKLFLGIPLTQDEEVDLIAFRYRFAQAADQQMSMQPVPPSTQAPQRPRRAKRVPEPTASQPTTTKKSALKPELAEISAAIRALTRDWEDKGIDTRNNPNFDSEADRITAEISEKYR